MLKMFPKPLLLLLLGVLFSPTVIRAKEFPNTATQMEMAAKQFVAALNENQLKKAKFAYDDPHRTGWYFMPKEDKDKNSTRKGLPLEEMNDDVSKLAMNLIKTGTSESGYEQVQMIMGYEAILKQVEKKPVWVRNPKWYFFSIFGTPAATGKWGWRVEGHHMVLSYTIEDGKVISPTPFFFGANPGIIKEGPKKGQSSLPNLQESAAELVKSLSEEQQKLAKSDMKQYPEIEENVGIVKLVDHKGIPYGKLNEAQQITLWALMNVYIGRMPKELAEEERKRIRDAGVEQIYFGYTGEPLNGFTFQILGPTFHARLTNVQPDGWGNPNNHIHSVWRRLPGDFGLTK